MTEPLKPCPCGSKAELHEDIAMSGKGQFWVQSEAGWVGPTKSEPDDAVDAWNTRLVAYLASPSREAIAKLMGFAARDRNDVSEDASEWWEYTGEAKRNELLKMADAILSLSPASPQRGDYQ